MVKRTCPIILLSIWVLSLSVDLQPANAQTKRASEPLPPHHPKIEGFVSPEPSNEPLPFEHADAFIELTEREAKLLDAFVEAMKIRSIADRDKMQRAPVEKLLTDALARSLGLPTQDDMIKKVEEEIRQEKKKEREKFEREQTKFDREHRIFREPLERSHTGKTGIEKDAV